MADHNFKEGDEVQHKTGKIKMIYIGDGSPGEALCEWADPNGHPQRANFAYAALKPYEAPAVGIIGTRGR